MCEAIACGCNGWRGRVLSICKTFSWIYWMQWLSFMSVISQGHQYLVPHLFSNNYSIRLTHRTFSFTHWACPVSSVPVILIWGEQQMKRHFSGRLNGKGDILYTHMNAPQKDSYPGGRHPGEKLRNYFYEIWTWEDSLSVSDQWLGIFFRPWAVGFGPLTVSTTGYLAEL